MGGIYGYINTCPRRRHWYRCTSQNGARFPIRPISTIRLIANASRRLYCLLLFGRLLIFRIFVRDVPQFLRIVRFRVLFLLFRLFGFILSPTRLDNCVNRDRSNSFNCFLMTFFFRMGRCSQFIRLSRLVSRPMRLPRRFHRFIFLFYRPINFTNRYSSFQRVLFLTSRTSTDIRNCPMGPNQCFTFFPRFKVDFPRVRGRFLMGVTRHDIPNNVRVTCFMSGPLMFLSCQRRLFLCELISVHQVRIR